MRDTAAGLRYVLYLYLSELARPWVVTRQPAGYFIAPEGDERVGDVSNVAFSNGWVVRPDGTVLIYYASADTRLHVALSTVERRWTMPCTRRRTACARQPACSSG